MSARQRELEGHLLALSPRPTLDYIARLVAEETGVPVERMKGRTRRREIVRPRQLAMFLACFYSDARPAEVGRFFNRHHPSVRNAVRKHVDVGR